MSSFMGEPLLGSVREALWKRLVRLNILRRPSLKYCLDNNLLPSMLIRTPSNTLRKMLSLPPSDYQTQLNQDVFALLMNKFRPGFFLEIGANDGFTLSNTVYLEREFGWKGILVEANPIYMDSLRNRKGSMVVNKAVSTRKESAVFVDAGLYGGLEAHLDSTHQQFTDGASCITIDCMPLQEVLDMTATPAEIDFVSIDVEGGEVPIIEQMVSAKRRFGCGCVEHNNRKGDYTRMVNLLEHAGYRVVWEGQTMHDLFFVDSELHPVRR